MDTQGLRRVECVPKATVTADVADRLDRSAHAGGSIHDAEAHGTRPWRQQPLQIVQVESAALKVGNEADAYADVREPEKRRKTPQKSRS